MAEKVLVFKHKETGKKFYFERITSDREPMTGQRKVVCVGYEQFGTTRIRMNSDILLGKDSLWEYQGGQVYEG